MSSTAESIEFSTIPYEQRQFAYALMLALQESKSEREQIQTIFKHINEYDEFREKQIEQLRQQIIELINVSPSLTFHLPIK